MSRELNENQIYRYSRNILIPEIGGEGQKKLLDAKVFCVGAGGLGSPAALYLAAAGVGTIGIADSDNVDISNLQRQVIHSTDDIGRTKTSSAKERLNKLNPEINIIEHSELICEQNIRDIIKDYDVVIDGSDNFATRYIVNDGCFFEKKTLISGAVLQFEGQVSVFKPHLGGPCYRCLFAEIPPQGVIASCQEAGIIGAVAGIVGSIQSLETIKELLNIGQSLDGRLLVINTLSMEIDELKIKKLGGCKLCGSSPSIDKVNGHPQGPCSGNS
ncbi:MAG TPA: HesA/MoeB/ThiF family protein [Thermodesulfobacteriota bacterium]|nr:HesA/MoeB/ThiF family protein [Thermodesulfobacteriota bacterium]